MNASDRSQVLNYFGQFEANTEDFQFLAELCEGKMTNEQIDRWFLSNEGRQAWLVAQGVLADVYGRDPP